MMGTRCGGFDGIRTKILFGAALAALTTVGLSTAQAATAKLRIATYNIEADIDGYTTPRTGLYSAIESMGSTSVLGNAQPVDILGLEETTSESATVSPIVTNLNTFYGSTAAYALTGAQGKESGNDPSTGNGPNSLIYNTKTLTLLKAVTVGTATGSSNGVYRQIMRYEFQPVKGAAADDFYVYVEHYKSGTGSDDAADRNKEAAVVRADAATLGSSAHIIYTGDFNTDPSETTFSTLESTTTAGAAIDPLNNANTKATYTDSSTSFKYRDDYELLTQPMLTDTTGLTYISGSYTAFGNNGSSTSATLSTLQTASDHVPVFADYAFTTVPEPGALALLAGSGLIALRRRRD